MSSSDGDDDQPLTLLTLPLEIREQIYTEILLYRHNLHTLPDDLSDPEPPPPGQYEAEWPTPRSHLSFDLRLFRVSKQICTEAEAVFRRINTFVGLQSPFPNTEHHMEEKGVLVVVASGDAAKNFKYIKLRCLIDVPEMRQRNECSRFVVAAADVPSFCRIWELYHVSHNCGLNQHLTLTLNLSGPTTAAMQRRLLAPFGSVRNLGQFHVNGYCGVELEKEIRKEMARAYDGPNECLVAAAGLKDAGNAALMAGHARKALELYVDAFKAMHIVIDGRRRQVWAEQFYETYIHTGQFKGMWGGIVRLELRIKLVANTIWAYIKLGDYREAYYWGMRTINLMRNGFGPGSDAPRRDMPAADACGKIYYRTAVAARALDRKDIAREMIRIATQWLPDDPKVKEDFATWGLLTLG